MKKEIDKESKAILALKYPDYHLWRDLSTVKNGYWPDGSPLRLSDPELQPTMDDLKKKIESDPEFAKELFRKLNLPTTYVA